MYTSETKQGRMYLPRTLFEDRGAVHEGRSIPNDLKESLKLFLRKRASVLMASPELDRKTYSDHPQAHELCDRERAEDVCVAHFFDDIGWPHKWTLAGSQPSGDSPEYRAMLKLNELHKSLRNTDKDMAEVIKSLAICILRLEILFLKAKENPLFCANFGWNSQWGMMAFSAKPGWTIIAGHRI